MRIDEIDTLIENLENFISRKIKDLNYDDIGHLLDLENSREDLREQLIDLFGDSDAKGKSNRTGK